MSLTCYIILAYLVVVDIRFTVFSLFPCELCVIRAGWRVLIGCGNNKSEPVVEESVAVCQTEVELCLFAHPVVSASCCSVEETAER